MSGGPHTLPDGTSDDALAPLPVVRGSGIEPQGSTVQTFNVMLDRAEPFAPDHRAAGLFRV